MSGRVIYTFPPTRSAFGLVECQLVAFPPGARTPEYHLVRRARSGVEVMLSTLTREQVGELAGALAHELLGP